MFTCSLLVDYVLLVVGCWLLCDGYRVLFDGCWSWFVVCVLLTVRCWTLFVVSCCKLLVVCC